MRFDAAFAVWARRVRGRLALRSALTGASFGLVGGTAAALALWWEHAATWRPFCAAFAVVGAIVALVFARRSRWTDEEVALYLDTRLGSREAISTAVELGRAGAAAKSDDATVAVTAEAVSALQNGDKKRASPRLLERLHWVGALGTLGIAAVFALPPRPPPVREAIADTVQKKSLRGIGAIERLKQLDLADAERRKRLADIADRAEALKKGLTTGLERRDALSQLSALGDAIKSERLRFAGEKNRPGLEEAISALDQDGRLERAARALGDGDISEFDREMQRLANLAELDARDAAKKVLEQAQSAAARRGAEELAKAIDEQRRLFEEREQAAEMLRELAQSFEGKLGDDARRALEEWNATGDPKAQRALTEALMDALEQMTDEERKRLAERLAKRANADDGEMQPMSRKELERLAKELSTEEGKRKVAEALRELAKSSPSDAAREQDALDEAERGRNEAQRDLSGTPLPVPGQGEGQGQGPSAQGPTAPKSAEGSGQGRGGGDDQGTAPHAGETNAVDGKGLRAKAYPRLDPTLPMQSTGSGRVPGRAGAAANEVGASGVTAAGPEEVRAIERTEIPTEYREQVGRYFEPQ